MHCHFFDRTVVFGSVIMKKTKSWYIGPVIGEISERHGSPVIQLRKNANAKNESTYVALMWIRLARQIITEPRIHITNNGQIKFPHWIVSAATVSGARNNKTQIPKFEGFQRCRPFTRNTYFDMIEITLHNAYGQNAGDRMRMPTLIPEMYALERLSHLPKKIRPSTSSATRAQTIASAVLS